jgi:hypothetical protein
MDITPEALKSLAFDIYINNHKPETVDLDRCDGYDAIKGSCLEQGAIPCDSCSAYVRMAEEFNAIPAG